MILDDFLTPVRRETLPNGLTLLLRRQPRGGVVAINTWVRAGYFHEPDEVAGMAHLFEHMFFKGSKSFPGAEDIAKQVSALGGSTNAGTIYDSTNYYFVLPKEGLLRGIEIQADAIANPLFDPDELRKEAEVVIEESNRKFDNPPAVAVERMFETAFTKHRMKRWRIGSNEVLRNINRDHLIEFFDTLYRPENIILSIAGDLEEEPTIEAVKRTFGAIPRGTPRKQRGPSEPKQNEFRFAESRGDISQSYSITGFHAPGEHHPDQEPLEVLASILGSGRFSRLYRTLVRPDAASSVSASHMVFEDVGMFTVRVVADDGNLERAEGEMFAEIEKIRRIPPTDYECQLGRNRIEAGFIFSLDDVLGQAQTLAAYEAQGSHRDIEGHLQRLLAVSPADVQRVAQKYLQHENTTLYRYRPMAAPAVDRSTVEQSVLGSRAAVAPTPGESHPIPSVAAPAAGAGADGQLRRFVLSNGVTLFVRESVGAPTVACSIYFRGGRTRESGGNAGITQLMARAMRRGTARRSGEEIDRDIEFLGSSLGVSVEEDFFGFSIDTLRKHFRGAVEILAEVINEPSFPERGIEIERALQIAAIRRSLDSSGERPFALLFEQLYPNHPYGLPGNGLPESVAAIRADEIEAWYRKSVTADAATIFVVGDVDADDCLETMETMFGSLAKSQELASPLLAPVAVTGMREIVEVRDRKQTAIAIGFPTVPPQHDDWTVLRLLQDVVSGLSGTFFAELRGKRSLAYTVFAGDSSRALAGAFVGYIATEAAKESAAREGLLTEMRRLDSTGFDDDDLSRAKSYLAGSMRIRLQTNRAVLSDLAENYLYGLGLDHTDRFLDRVRAIPAEQVKAVAKRYLSGDNYVVAILRGRPQGD